MLIISIVGILALDQAAGQELLCNVQIVSQQIAISDKTVFEEMQRSIYEFVNQRKWTEDTYGEDERIECSILINITNRISNDEYSGTIQVQSRRPVYGTSYNAPILNYVDKNFQFQYLQFQTLEFSETANTDNLTSVLAYYVYMILGMDYDSFSMMGGTRYYQKALAIVNNSSNAREPGWKAFEGTDNRYWLVNNILDPQFANLRKAFYKYHRMGMDKMSEKVEEGRSEVENAIKLIEKVYQSKPNNLNVRLFFLAKVDELVNLFSQAYPDEKTRVVNLLNRMDPGNQSNWQKILQGK